MKPVVAIVLVQCVAVLSACWLSNRRRLLDRGLPYLVCVAVGVLLATALLHMLPESVAVLGNRGALWLTFAGTIFTMFCIERLFAAIATDSAHSADHGTHQHVAGYPARPYGLVVGSLLHSFVDGISVAAAFAAGPRVGWLTAGAIALHEVPHRMGDYAVLLHLRLSRARAIQMVSLVGVAALAGVLLVLLAGHAAGATQWLLPVSAGSFVYIALVNLMPELAGQSSVRSAVGQILCMGFGAGLVVLLLRLPLG